ncbi:MAG: hypothetical protein R3Y35_08205 [Clostridia bacterium]
MKLKRLLALLLASAMFVTAFTACSSSSSSSSSSTDDSEDASSDVVVETDEDGVEVVGNTYVEGLPIAVEPITYTIMNNKGSSDYSSSNNEKEFVILSTEGTNISLEWTETSETLYDEQVSLILSTGQNMPDAFMYYATDTAMATNAEMFYELTDEILYTFAPNITSQVEEYVDGGLDALRKDDGNIYSLPTGVWSEYANNASAITYIRQDWLDALGMEVPTTIEELYTVLTAFKENDMNGDGDTTDEIPFVYCEANWAGKLISMAGSWGIAGRNLNNSSWYGQVEDGVYTLNVTDQSFYDYVTEMNKWSSEGLINADGFTLTSSEYSSLTNTLESYGMLTTWTPDETEYANGCWTALPVLTVEGYEGEELKAGDENLVTANLNGFIISCECEEPEGLLRWWDYLHSDTTWKLISRDGPEGVTWYYGDDGVAYVTNPDEWPTGITSSTEYVNTYGMRSYCAAIFTGESAIPDPADGVTSDSIRYEVSGYYFDYFPDELIPTYSVPADAAEDFAFIQTEIETAVANFYGSAVVNGFTDADWDAYVASLDSLGIDDFVQYYQNYVDNSWD